MSKNEESDSERQSAGKYVTARKEVLVALACNGDQPAFTELVNREKNTVYSRMLRLCNDPTTAEDLTQIAFVESWSSLGKLKSTAAFDSWLRTISINIWMQYLKKHSREREKITEFSNIELMNDISGDHISILIDLDEALKKLSDAERLHIVLSYHEGLSHSAIAELTKQPLGTVKSNILRGSKKLRHILLGYNEK